MRKSELNDERETVIWSGKKAVLTSVLDAVLNRGILLSLVILLADVLVFMMILSKTGPKSAMAYYRSVTWLHWLPAAVYLIGIAVSVTRSVTTVYAVTNKYVYAASGLFRRTVLSNDIDDVEYVSVGKNLADRWTHTGDLTVFTKDEIEKNGRLIPEERALKFDNIKDVTRVYTLIERIRKREGSMTDPAFIEDLMKN